MLQGLDTVEWLNLKHNFGTAENLPDLLRQMLSDDAKTHRAATDDLLECICHQGTIVEATAPVVPFLIQMLAMDDFQDKAGIMGWFYFQLAPCSYWMYHHVPNLTGWMADIHREVAKGLPVYLSLLNDPDTRVRSHATAILYEAWFPDDKAPAIADTLRQRIADEADEDIRIIAIHGLAELVAGHRQLLAGRIAEDIRLFQRLWQSEQGSIQYVAGSSLTKLMEDQTPEEIVQRLILGLAHPLLSKRFPNAETPEFIVPTVPVTEDSEAISAFRHLGLERRLQAYRDAFNRMDSAKHARRIAQRLLHMAFIDRPDRFWGFGRESKTKFGKPIIHYKKTKYICALDALTSEQRRIVRVVLEADKVWEVPHNMLEMFGILGSRRKLLAWLKKEGLP